jgi:hypothetical protein
MRKVDPHRYGILDERIHSQHISIATVEQPWRLDAARTGYIGPIALARLSAEVLGDEINAKFPWVDGMQPVTHLHWHPLSASCRNSIIGLLKVAFND